MHCAACSSRIERVVSQLDGVESAQVNLAAEKMKCSFDDTQISLEAIADRVASIGFGLEEDNSYLKDVTYDISGMHCASCSARIENVLKNRQGILSAEVNLATRDGSHTLRQPSYSYPTDPGGNRQSWFYG